MSLPQLSPALLNNRKNLLPDYDRLRRLPEKVLQFGTGVLLRGLPDYFIDKANRQGLFNGRIVVVKSTGSGKVDAFAEQDNLYTHCIRGIQDGQAVEETLVNASISRTLAASTDWEAVLTAVENPAMEVIISNTTEVGIQLTDDDIHANPPVSFPGKLTACLYRRFRAAGKEAPGFVIIPTELLPDNGKKLKEIVLEHARRHKLEADFVEWVENRNTFCSSLVDRIVPGQPPADILASLTSELGYRDDLLIMSEVYRLWAIEGSDHVRNILSFAEADAGVIITPDIDLYRELKLRLLNGTHTLCVGLCYLYGKNTVRESMESPELEKYIQDLMLGELGPAIPYPVEKEVYEPFGRQVLDRFRNPSIRHQLLDITVQYTAKMKMRNIPTLLEHYRRSGQVPRRFALGFAAYLVFMKAESLTDGIYYGQRNGVPYPIRCDAASYFYERWQQFGANTGELVMHVLADKNIWGADLSTLPGFADQVKEYVSVILQGGLSGLVS